MKKAPFIFFLSVLTVLMLSHKDVQASGYCDMETALSAYNSALKRKKLGDEEVAFKQFLVLAKMGLAPAQRHVAQYYLEESREDMAIEKGILWAQLATWGGDEEASRILKSAVQSSRYAVVDTAMAWSKGWRASPPDCAVSPTSTEVKDGFTVVGRYPVIRQENVDEDAFVKLGLRLEEALLIAEKVAPYFYPLVELIPAIEVIKGEETDRLIQWSEEQGWVQVSSGYLGDKTARQLSYALVLAMQRHIFDEIEDATFADPIAGKYGATKIFGALYGDAKNDRFISLFQDAIKAARDLPVVMRDKVNLVDEVHYMLPSRYHVTRLSQNRRLSLYDYQRSKPDMRRMMIVKKVPFEEPKDLLLELVRIGTQIQQHAMIEGMRGKAGSKKREDAILRALQGDMSAAKDAFGKTSQDQQALVREWDEKGPDGIDKFYCESVFWQAKAAILMEMSPIRVTRNVNFNGCKKARTLWSEYRNKIGK